MKKMTCAIALLMLTIVSFGQTWYGSNPTFNDGFNGSVDWNGTATINGKVTFTNAKSFDKVNVTAGSTLTLQQDAEFYNGSQISGKLNGAAVKFDNTNTITGTLNATSLEVNNGNVALSGCGMVNVKSLSIHQDNLFTGTGLVMITGSYSNENYHPLTASSSIFVNYQGTFTGFGSAQLSTSTGACNITTPVVFKSFQAEADNAHNSIIFEWTTMTESNVDHFEVIQTSDVKTPIIVAYIAAAGNSASPESYSATVTFADVTMAAFGQGFFGLLLLVGMAVGLWRKRKMLVMIACVVIVGGTSCTKEVQKAVIKSKTETFQLRAVDKDGNTSYFTTVGVHVSK